MRFVVVVAVLLFSLAGCVPDGLPVVSSPAPSVSPAPVFASEEEALAAAEEAYVRYQEVSDAIAHEGGKDPERLLEVASPDLVEVDVASWREFAASGYTSSGASGYSNFALQYFDNPMRPQEDAIRVYLCSDISSVNVFDANGLPVFTTGRREHTPLEVSFDLVAPDSLLVGSRDVWEGEGVC